ncbi:GA4 desaturase family protein [Talaromyces proteolyticus]|uniref:GA4 desaturase family protein n=1 Tax=Talaromyces proteolyticus TaxID=1131652 RepID=A0AAD4L2R1_9EURO|nr:GA4 desaturase family protein [Talaromyces proteolyticus]KAH8705525.1 GA4 desaturase family protein [Talaromyces proteolyticus]
MATTQVIQTTLSYFPSDVKREIVVGTVGAYREPLDHKDMTIQDIRGHLSDFNLDVHGFQVMQHPSSFVSSSVDQTTIKEKMYPEAVEMLKQVTGATHAVVFSHMLRNEPYETVQEMAASTEPNEKETHVFVPARGVHVDQSEAGAHAVLNDKIDPEEVARLAKTRWAIINVWRPLKRVPRDPLAVCDARSINTDDLIEIHAMMPGPEEKDHDAITKGAGFGALYGKYSPAHKWYYMSDMEPDEVMLIKCFDTKYDSNTACRALHAAFVDPRTEHVKEVRESLELRCFVFFEDEPLK